MMAVERFVSMETAIIVVLVVSLVWISRDHLMNGAMRMQEWWYGQHGFHRSRYDKRAIQEAKVRHPSSPNNVYTFPQREAQFYDQDEDAS